MMPCGGCLGCREDKSKTWAVRLVHEASLYEKNCFITLTYNEDHYPEKGSLVKEHMELFFKRLRKKYVPKCPFPKSKDPEIQAQRKDWLQKHGIRYYYCGEYGDQFGRPHYHACLFNFDFPMKSKEHPDGKVLWKETSGGNLYRCRALEVLWPFGFVSVGAVTFDSAAYVARYIIKKINGEMAPGHYMGRQPEFAEQSRRPGIAKAWYEKYKNSDIPLAYRNGFITMNGKTYRIPKYYDNNFEITDPLLFQSVKETRKIKALENPDNTPERLASRKIVHQARHKQRKRGYEN